SAPGSSAPSSARSSRATQSDTVQSSRALHRRRVCYKTKSLPHLPSPHLLPCRRLNSPAIHTITVPAFSLLTNLNLCSIIICARAASPSHTPPHPAPACYWQDATTARRSSSARERICVHVT